MAKYTEQSVVSYNTSPPPDDGTETEANRVKWVTIKDKLTDPLNTGIGDVDDAVAAMTATTFLNNVQAKTANFTVATSDQGDGFTTTNAITATLTAAATLGKGFACAFFNSDASDDLTIDPNAAETINGSATLTVGAGEGVIIFTDGVNWFAPARFFTETAIGSATTTTAGIVEKATAAEVRSETADKFPDASDVQFAPGMAKAWAHFDSAGSIADSDNVASITDNGVGDWTVNIDDNMSNSNYSAHVTVESRTTSAIDMGCVRTSGFAVGTCRVRGMNVGLAAVDPPSILVTIHGDR